MANGKRGKLPKELEDVAFTQDVNALQEQVDQCYSTQRYKEFQEAVEDIIWRFLKGFIGFAVFIWLATMVGSMLIQKYFAIFGVH